jgi:hypothetical protein
LVHFLFNSSIALTNIIKDSILINANGANLNLVQGLGALYRARVLDGDALSYVEKTLRVQVCS